ncbi:circularly permuted type 2 ATP-grasp protein [Ferrimicrobium sp.]|uniref:circularly permuted type 2 ATP-grasp protein n=1 Tax=Ferrimicrobium sp. TaxID=2926050 RepID=UPI00261A350B|nr:circularly permuted type 2 ATP-grasp protein [Ferrimicrobium sp.]
MENTLLDAYAISDTFDEVLTAPGLPRPGCMELYSALQELSETEFEQRCQERDLSFRDRGVTYSFAGLEAPFPLDPIPRIISSQEWAYLESGVIQRVRALEAFLDDVFTQQRIFRDRIIPHRLVLSSPLFIRQAYGLAPANGVRIHISGMDIVRGHDGKLMVLEDNLRTPSGVSYVLENRRSMTRIFPEFFRGNRVRPVANYPTELLRALVAAAPQGATSDPKVVLLTPGIHNAAYFEHTFLARQMGVDLVEGGDLACRDGICYLHTTEGDQRVDVIYRRISDDYLDPLYFEPSSLLGVPGLVTCIRAGNLTVANAIGNGVADDKLTYTYVPDMIRYYLGEEPILANVPTYRLEDPEVRSWVVKRLDQLVLKPVDASGGTGIVIGPDADEATLLAARAAMLANPRGWIAQEVVRLSTCPTRVPEGIEPRHIDLRPFVINQGDRIWVLPGGLTRVALPKGSLIVNSSQGGGSKDTWVLDATADKVDLHPTNGVAAGEHLVHQATAPEPDHPLQSTKQQEQ